MKTRTNHGAEITLGTTDSPAVAPVANCSSARRRLIVAFFNLGVVNRYQITHECGLLTEEDKDLDGQERWAVAFKRAEERGIMDQLEAAVSRRTNAELRDRSGSGTPTHPEPTE